MLDKFKSMMDKFKVEDELDDEIYGEDGVDYDYDEPVQTPQYESYSKPEMTKSSNSSTTSSFGGFGFSSSTPKVQNHRPTPMGEPGHTIHVIKPTKVESWKTICDHLLANEVVIINLDGTDATIPQRITDALSGASYALQATFRYINHNIMIVVPRDIELKGDVQRSMNETLNKLAEEDGSFDYDSYDRVYE